MLIKYRVHQIQQIEAKNNNTFRQPKSTFVYTLILL